MKGNPTNRIDIKSGTRKITPYLIRKVFLIIIFTYCFFKLTVAILKQFKFISDRDTEFQVNLRKFV